MEEIKFRATPAARALAKRLGVSLLNVEGTGPKGRIHKITLTLLILLHFLHTSKYSLVAKLSSCELS